MVMRIFSKDQGPRGALDYAFDFLIVVAGVFLGLQAQTWAEHRGDRAQEARFLERLETEFAALRDETERCLALYDGAGEAAGIVRVSLAAYRGDGASLDLDAFETALIRMTAGTLPPGRAAAYLEMVSASELDLIRDAGLREALVRYDETATTNREHWRALRAQAAPAFSPLYAHIALERGDTPGASKIAALRLGDMAADPRIDAAVTTAVATATNSYALCELQREHVNAVEARFAGDTPR